MARERTVSELAYWLLSVGLVFGWIAGFDTARSLYKSKVEQTSRHLKSSDNPDRV